MEEARHGAPREPTTERRKRALDEVVPPEFVAREDEGGAYGLREMPKRFVHACVANKGRGALSDPILRAMELDDARFTAKHLRVTSFARAAAAAADSSAGHSASSPSSL